MVNYPTNGPDDDLRRARTAVASSEAIDRLTRERDEAQARARVVYLPDGGMYQFVAKDVPTFAAEQVAATIIREIGTRRIVGVQWNEEDIMSALTEASDE